MNKIKSVILGIAIFITFLIVYFLSYNLAEPKAYDFMVRNFLTNKLPIDKQKQVHGSDDIVLIVIDNISVQRYRWPWKREKYCNIYNYFSTYAKPKAIVHDAIIVTDDIENPDSDKKFYNSVKKTNNLIVGYLPLWNQWTDKNFGQKYDNNFKRFSIKVKDNSKVISHYYNSIYAMPESYQNVVKYAGSVSMISGFFNGDNIIWARDEINRTQEYLFYYKGNYYPSLALMTYLYANDFPEIVLDDNYMRIPELNRNIKIQKSSFLTLVPTKYYKFYNNGYSHKKYSAIDVIDSYNAIVQGKKPILSPELFKDKIVVIGANVPTGTGINDNKNSPLTNHHPGVDYQATAIDNILHNDFLFVIPVAWNILITLLGMLLIYFGIKLSDLYKAITITLITIFGYFIICAICFYLSIVINVITPIAMFVITTIFAYLFKYLTEYRSKEKVKNAMGKYMSKDIMKNVLQNIDNLGLGGKKAEVTVLFADIRGFTTLSEKMSAQQVSELLNEYFSEMEPIITSYNGIINKFIGDAIMAVFGEPIQDTEHAQNAVKCGYAMLKAVQKLDKRWTKEGKPEIEIGIGINTGEVFIGNIGSVNRMEYTVIGDTVNLASRLESYNKTYKTKMLISKSTYNRAKSFAYVIKIPDVQIRGKANKMDIYEVLKVKLH
ncbi:MAG: adenylate/guanylate cyclase domain-containing protein [bacterium]|nr:adenylate/guanylate cyclase domain-containing protein [bacterium]